MTSKNDIYGLVSLKFPVHSPHPPRQICTHCFPLSYSFFFLFLMQIQAYSTAADLGEGWVEPTKGTVSRDFLLLVFFMNQFPPQHYSIPFRPFQNCPRYQRHRRQIFSPFLLALMLILVANLPLVSTIPVAILSLVSTTTVANCHRYQRHRWQICHQCKVHRWQTIGTLSNC